MRTKLGIFCAVLALTAVSGWIEAGESTDRNADARSRWLPGVEMAFGGASPIVRSVLALEFRCINPVVVPLDGIRFMVRCETPSGSSVRVLVFHNPATINDDIGPFRGSKAKTDELPMGEPDEDDW